MAREFTLTSHLKNPPDLVWEQVQKPALFLHVAGPLVAFEPQGMDSFPAQWAELEYRGSMRLFGVLPIGWQAIKIRLLAPEGSTRTLVDEGYGPMLKQWSHRIEVAPEGDGTRYSDILTFDAGALTPLAAPLIRLFFAHRQRRLRKLDASGFEELKG